MNPNAVEKDHPENSPFWRVGFLKAENRLLRRALERIVETAPQHGEDVSLSIAKKTLEQL